VRGEKTRLGNGLETMLAVLLYLLIRLNFLAAEAKKDGWMVQGKAKNRTSSQGFQVFFDHILAFRHLIRPPKC